MSNYKKVIPCNKCGADLYWEKGDRRPYDNATKDYHECPVWLAEQGRTQAQMHKDPPKTQQQPILSPKTVVEQAENHNTLREICTILQGIAAQLKNIADNQDVANRYAKITKDILQEYKDEVIDTINSKPKIQFESGKLEESDLYDELSDQDDTTDEGPHINGFKPSDTGSRNVRNDI